MPIDPVYPRIQRHYAPGTPMIGGYGRPPLFHADKNSRLLIFLDNNQP